MNRLTLVAVATVLMLSAVTAYADVALISPITMSPSVTSQGIGNAGVTSVDALSHALNPASLALRSGERYVAGSFFPVHAEWDTFDNLDFSAFGLSAGMPLNGGQTESQWQLAAAYHRNQLNYVMLTETGAEENDINDRTDNVTLALAYSGSVQAAFGVSYRRFSHNGPVPGAGIEIDAADESSSLFDFGLHLRKPIEMGQTVADEGKSRSLAITPAAGISFLSIGPDGYFIDFGQKDPPPRTLRAGLSAAVERRQGNLIAYSLTPIVEMERLLFSDAEMNWHIAGEVGILESIYARVGRTILGGADAGQTAWGFTVSTRGLGKYLRRNVTSPESSAADWLNRLTVEYSYAKYADDQALFTSGLRYMSVDVMLRF